VFEQVVRSDEVIE